MVVVVVVVGLEFTPPAADAAAAAAAAATDCYPDHLLRPSTTIAKQGHKNDAGTTE